MCEMCGFFFLNLDAIVDQLCKSLNCQSVKIVFTRRSGNKWNLSIIVIEQSPFDKVKVHAVENSMTMFTWSILLSLAKNIHVLFKLKDFV